MGVSVIIPCRNMASTLERAVSSAVNAGASQVLIYDDGSEIDTDEQMLKYYKPFGEDLIRFGFHPEYHIGVSAARNTLITISRNEWIIPLDADDELLTIPPIPENENEFVYGGWIEHYTDGSEKVFEANAPKMLKHKPLCHATMLFSKAQWQAVGGYDPDFFYGEDFAFQCALVQAGFVPKRLDYPLYKRYVGDNSRSDKATRFWPVIQELAREKYPTVFT